MKFFLENRVRAGVILAVIILITPIFGTWRSVAVQARRVEKEFTKKDRFGETVSATLSDLAYHSTLFADLYEQALDKDDSCAALRRAAAEIETAVRILLSLAVNTPSSNAIQKHCLTDF